MAAFLPPKKTKKVEIRFSTSDVCSQKASKMINLGLLRVDLGRLMLLFCLIGLQALIAPNMTQAQTAAYPGPALKRLFDLSCADLAPPTREMAEIGAIAPAH